MSNYNFDDVPKREVIEDGIYEAEITDVKLAETKKGDPQKQITFRLINGKTILDFLVDTEKTLWKVQSLFKACGHKSEGKVKISDNWKELWGIPLQIQIGMEEYNGKRNSRVQVYAPIKREEEIDI